MQWLVLIKINKVSCSALQGPVTAWMGECVHLCRVAGVISYTATWQVTPYSSEMEFREELQCIHT